MLIHQCSLVPHLGNPLRSVRNDLLSTQRQDVQLQQCVEIKMTGGTAGEQTAMAEGVVEVAPSRTKVRDEVAVPSNA